MVINSWDDFSSIDKLKSLLILFKKVLWKYLWESNKLNTYSHAVFVFKLHVHQIILLLLCRDLRFISIWHYINTVIEYHLVILSMKVSKWLLACVYYADIIFSAIGSGKLKALYATTIGKIFGIIC